MNYDALLSRVDMWLGSKDIKSGELPGDKVSEMRVLMGEEAFRDALGVLSKSASDIRYCTKSCWRGSCEASAELHTLYGIYAGYGFEELQHLSRALQDSCDANLAPPLQSSQQFDELSSSFWKKLKTTVANYGLVRWLFLFSVAG